MKTSKEIRNSFLEFFKEKDHSFIRSSPVVPIDDPTLLFTNAGMNQFKPIFLDQIQPEHLRSVNSQKCIRVSGKHNDLEEVGVDTFHHTFFEMLGNWSFGDYYKKEAIEWAWELFTNNWGLDRDRLWATVYKDDDEAFQLWTEVTDIKPERVIRCGKKDNFWEMGETGPCGPCSEIHYYIGNSPESQNASGVNSSDEYWELWNLVFIQNNRLEDGSLVELPSKHVDTGAGLERIAAVLQDKTSNYDTDLFQPIIYAIQEWANSSYDRDPIPHRVIADHIRMLCFSIADGALPSNDGRGYVLRRILRRAARFGKSLGFEEPFMFKLVPVVGEIMGEIFPEVIDKQTHIENVIRSEEESFNHTLDRGLNHFKKIISGIKGSEISGEDAFKLYDTYGFPLDLTQLMAKENNLVVNEKIFNESMRRQKEKAKASGKFKVSTDELNWLDVSDGYDSQFIGYDSVNSESKIIRYAVGSEKKVYVILDQTPFYAESGGQIGDTGSIIGNDVTLEVLDVKKENESIIHICTGKINVGNAAVHCKVDVARRDSIKRNHTATHLMHKALKIILGEHVNQAGSLVHPDYLRFDLTHFEKITEDQIKEIERLVNNQIISNVELDVSIQKFDEAKGQGAEALFGEKYGDTVRVVKVSDYSMELCGGTHVVRTGDIGLFKIIEESSLSSGVRRIVALTGDSALREVQDNALILNGLQRQFNVSTLEIIDRVNNLINEKKELEKKLKNRSRPNLDSEILSNLERIEDNIYVVKEVAVDSMDELKSIGDQVFNRIASGIVALFSKGKEKPMALVIVTKQLNKSGILAGELAKKIGVFMEGGGGGKPHMATAGGKNNDLLVKAMGKTKNMIMNILKEI
ncbi:MAG: alanine--tRNA ligase [Candidatus Marinimicrobia bacterium]|nr:alanine--tRNA ligase [Candidatus Neomarinimicrobiota bacterium]|tara:strand:- start:1866 stop:4448 length:2583 start_codon:yes stop_codon:yes gene_type:complete